MAASSFAVATSRSLTPWSLATARVLLSGLKATLVAHPPGVLTVAF
jgi:hypothetical protein